MGFRLFVVAFLALIGPLLAFLRVETFNDGFRRPEPGWTEERVQAVAGEPDAVVRGDTWVAGADHEYRYTSLLSSHAYAIGFRGGRVVGKMRRLAS